MQHTTHPIPPPMPFLTRNRWGSWRYDHETIELVLDRFPNYRIDLERATTSAEVLDWIVQITKKNWATSKILADLCIAFNDLLSPQATLCSSGEDTPIRDVRAVLRCHGYQVPSGR